MALSGIIANPLRLNGCGLPPQVVLLCRLLALALLLTNHQRQIQTPFLPFLSVFDLVPGETFQMLLRVMLVGGSLGILFTRKTRWFAAVAGIAMLLAVLSSRTYYGNNKTFTGLMLVLSALSDETSPPRLLQWQMALVYFGAGLNKAADADWQTGQFFEHWASVRLENPLYIWLSTQMAPLVAGKLFCWFTIITELSLAGLMMFPRFHRFVIWGSGLFQASLFLFTGDLFNLFFFSMQVSLFAFVRWPREQLIAIWDGSCGFCRRTKELVERVDFEPILDWRKQQSGIGDRYGITREQLRQALYVIGAGWIASGYNATRRIILHLPLFWMTLLTLLVFVPGANGKRVAVGLAICFLSPLSNPVGNLIYRWVARHRHELLAGETCEVD